MKVDIDQIRIKSGRIRLCLITYLFLSIVSGQNNSDLYFYHGQTVGSEYQFGPLNILLNVGFVTTGRMTQSPRFSDIDFERNRTILENSLIHQRIAINDDYEDGFKEFFLTEFVPPYLPAFPNYALHFIGEGMLYRKLEEYYRFQGINKIWSRTLSISSIVLCQQINELVEFGYPLHPKSDPVSDLYFNTAGIIAFSFDNVAKLFSNDYINLYYWSGQPIIDIRDNALFNHQESYLLRATLGRSRDIKLALLFGLPANGLGFSFPLKNGDYFSLMPFATDQITRSPGYVPPTREELLEDADGGDPHLDISYNVIVEEFNYSINAYWDRNGSLLASVAVGYEPVFSLAMNIYPGVLQFNGVRFGGYLITSETGASSMGFTASVSPVMPGIRF